MRPSEDCLQVAMRLEGFRAHAYLCSGGRWTVGYGTTIWPDGRRVREWDRITQGEAEQMLRERFRRHAERIDRDVERELTQGQVDALCLFFDNMPQSRWPGSTILRLLRAGDFAAAAAEFPRWNKAGGRVVSGLVSRRGIERRFFEKG